MTRQRSWCFEPLTPTSLLTRAAIVHGSRVAVIDGEESWSFAEMEDRCLRIATGLALRAAGRPIAVLAANGHELLELHYAVPWSGSPLVPLNTRLAPTELAWILHHSETAVLVYDQSVESTAKATLRAVPGLEGIAIGGPHDEYQSLASGTLRQRVEVTDEMGLLSINYTSGTTGQPKGVMYSHRGAYLQALAMVVHTGLRADDRYLWTLPMFHCSGWCFTWAVTAAGATHVCLPRFDPAEVWRLVHEEGITKLCGAPTVLTMLGYHEEAAPPRDRRRLEIFTGGAPPSPAILERMEHLGAAVTHLYGLTETYGPAVVCDWHPEWDARPQDERARLKARQGVGNVVAQPIRVLDQSDRDVTPDGLTIGEVAIRGNDVMTGYFRDEEATAVATRSGWFRTGDLAVMHPDGYIELRDRLKDVIISGGENISSVEVEHAVSAHPAVLECAVVACPDERVTIQVSLARRALLVRH